MYFHYFNGGAFSLALSILIVSFNLFRWFADIITEATYEGHHTFKVQQNILLGMLLFITSEIMFFFAFFWAFFHFSLSPSIWVGGVWPPKGIHTLSFTALPLLNTVILLSSGVTVTYAHRAIVQGDFRKTTVGLAATIFYGIIFTLLQKGEYDGASFSINDSVYGSIFYMTTGFHGVHVFIGTLFLFICLGRHLFHHFFKNHHVGFVCAAWY
jgi:cytochrome c oxidase subunit 3